MSLRSAPVRATLIVILVGAGLLPPSAGPSNAQTGLECSGYAGSSKVSEKGPFGLGKTDVVELESRIDGSKIQVGFVRPDAPPAHRSPVIVHASPYFYGDLREVSLADCNPFLVQNFVQHGYTIAFVPTRGAGGTDSCADLMGRKERSDLDQAVDWLGSQRWSNGNVGMIGLSYDGSTPWDVAAMGNPHLKTIVPESGVHSLFDLVYLRGRNDWRWWLFVPGYYHYYGLGFANPLFGRDPDRYAASANCETTDEGLAATLESYRTNEPDSFGYWQERHNSDDVLKRYEGSVFLVQGMQDWNVDPGHQYPFVNKLEARGTYVKHLLGQWDHDVPDSDHPGQRGDFADILLQWWDRWLKGDRSADLGARAEVQDSDLRWRREEAWPPTDSKKRVFYLSADGTLTRSPTRGRAAATLGPGSRNRYFFLNSNDQVYNDAPVDHFCVACATFTHEVKGGALRMTGLPELDLKLVPTGPGGYVAAYVFRVDEDDAWHFLGWGASDLRFPNGGYKARPVTAGQTIDMKLPLQPMEGVVHNGERLLIVLDQGHADHMPTPPFFPVQLRYGGELGAFHFDAIRPRRRDFFEPPALPSGAAQ